MARKERIFTNKKRRVYRTHVSRAEQIFGGSFVGFLVLGGIWFGLRGDDFDPAERDISMEVMEESQVEDTLYRSPLQRWTDPAQTGSTAPTYQLGIFPTSILEDGWVPSSRPQRFDESNLFEKINGAAPQYFQYGFSALHFLAIKKEQEELEINIELYDMAQFPNALGIFAAQRDDDRELEDLDGAHYYLTAAGALGVFDKYYFKLTGNQNSDPVRNKAQQLVDAISGLPAGSRQASAIYSVFSEGLGIPFERIVFEKNDVFQYDFAHDFWFARPEASSDSRYYVHRAGTNDEAQQLYDQLLENHLYDFTLVEQSSNKVVLKHNFLNNFMVLARYENWIYGIENVPAVGSVERALITLTDALFADEEI